MTPTPVVLGLFSGIGFLDRCFEDVGFCVVRGPDLLWGHDVKGWHPARDAFDGVIAGVPCQRWSSLAHIVRHVHGEDAVAPDLFPELERVVAEAGPRWFLTECAPKAPVPNVPGYAVSTLLLDNRWVGEGIGGVQSRRRRFCFGVREQVGESSEYEHAVSSHAEPVTVALGGSGKPKKQVRGYVQDVTPDLAALEASQRERPVTGKDHSGDVQDRLGARTAAVRRHVQDVSPDLSLFDSPERERAVITKPITSGAEYTRFKLDRGGRERPWVRRAVLDCSPDVALLEHPESQPAVMASESKAHEHARPDDGGGALPNHRRRRTVADCLELQGWPRDFLDHAPFTVEMEYRLVGNGVTRPVGLAIARAVKRALGYSL